MDQRLWGKIEEIFHGARERPPDQRPKFLAAACGYDADLLREVQQLLARDEQSTAIADAGAVAQAAILPTAQLPPGARLGPYRITGSQLGDPGDFSRSRVRSNSSRFPPRDPPSMG